MELNDKAKSWLNRVRLELVRSTGLDFEITDSSNPDERVLEVKVLAKPEGASATPEEAQLFSLFSPLGEAWTVDRCRELFRPSAGAVQYGHDRGVVHHRNMKPEKVMVTTSREVKILDP